MVIVVLCSGQIRGAPSIFCRGIEEQNCFFSNGVKNYAESHTDCRNFQSSLVNQKLNVEVCDDDVMEVCDVFEKCASCCSKVCVSCVCAVLRLCG